MGSRFVVSGVASPVPDGPESLLDFFQALDSQGFWNYTLYRGGRFVKKAIIDAEDH